MLFMKFGEREMQATHFFCLSGSKWETISVQDTIRVYSRQSTIIPAMIGHTCAVRHVVRLVSKKCRSFNGFPSDMSDMPLFFLQVHNGRDFVPVVINEGMALALKFCSFQWVLSQPKASQTEPPSDSNMKNRALSLKHLSSENKNRGCLGYVGDYTTQLYGVYNTVSHCKDSYWSTSIVR